MHDYHMILESMKNGYEDRNEDMQRCKFVLVELNSTVGEVSEALDDFHPELTNAMTFRLRKASHRSNSYPP